MCLRSKRHGNTHSLHKKHRYAPYVMPRFFQTQACRLFAFQKRCIRWLTTQRKKSVCSNGVIVNMDVGLGKTVISLKHAQIYHWRVLYLCPPNVVSHIQQEVTKHFGSGIRTQVLTTWPTAWHVIKNAHVTIMSYHTVSRIKKEDIKSPFCHFRTCIVDEVQDGAHKKGVCEALAAFIHADFFIGLTAMENPTIGPLLKLVHAKCYKQVFTFRQPPTFIHQTKWIDMSPETRNAYDRIKQQVLLLQQKSDKNSGLRKHRLLQSSWHLLSLAKVDAVAEMLRQVPPHFKVFIVSNFEETLRALAATIPDKSRYVLLDTRVREHYNRQRLLDRFHQNDSCTFFFACLSIINFGVNVGFSDALIVVEPPYYAHEKAQLCGRLRRCGQRPKNVQMQYIIDVVVANSSDSVLFDCNNSGST